jgi:Tfp pilus assembly protein PilF
MLTWARARVLAGAAACAAHLPVLSGGFVWLDHAHLEQGLALANGHWLTTLSQGFAGTGYYRPLMSLSLSFDQALGGQPWLFHAVTLAWHVAAAVSTVVAARALGLQLRAAALAGLLFAVHPLGSLVAGAIAFRSEAMLAVALLWLIVAHARQRSGLAALALLAAALTKETGLVLGPLFVAVLALRSSANRQRLLAAEGAALACALLLRVAFAPTFRAEYADLSLSEALGTRLAALAKSVGALLPIVGWDRTICDAFSKTPLSALSALAGLLVAGGLLWLAWRRRGVALLFALSLLPALQLVPVMRWWSPHYAYVALAFAAMLTAELVLRTNAQHFKLALFAVLALGAVSFHDAWRFQSDDALWSRELARQPECREAHFYLAEVARQQRSWQPAQTHYEHAVSVNPRWLSYVDSKAAFTNLGVVLLEQKQGAQARAAFGSALPLASDELERRHITYDLASAALMAGDSAAAAVLLESEVERPDALPQSVLTRAKALRALGRESEARALAARLLVSGQAP